MSAIPPQAGAVSLRPTQPRDLDFVLTAEADPQSHAWVTPWQRQELGP